MRKIVVWFETGGGIEVPANSNFLIKSAHRINYLEWTCATYCAAKLSNPGGRPQCVLGLFSDENGITVRLPGTTSNISVLNSLTIWADFELDELSIFSVGTATPYVGRLEIRNEYGVLIADNGVSWGDGTYPPDAKNRAGLAGLHAAPAVINPELETALMGDETNKERVQE